MTAAVISMLAAANVWAIVGPILGVLVLAAAGFLIWFIPRQKKRAEQERERRRQEEEKRRAIRESVTSQILQQKAQDYRSERMAKAAPKTVIDAPREFGRKSVFGSGSRTGDREDDKK